MNLIVTKKIPILTVSFFTAGLVSNLLNCILKLNFKSLALIALPCLVLSPHLCSTACMREPEPIGHLS